MLALSAIAMVAFTSCKPINNPDTVVSVVNVTPETLLMSVGQTEKLSATVSPNPTTTVTFVWTSDNDSVASVKCRSTRILDYRGTVPRLLCWQ